MSTIRPHPVLKVGALALTLSLSGLYIYFEFRDQPAPEEADSAATDGEVYSMSITPDLDLIEALPKSGPIHFDPDSFNPKQAEANPSNDGYQDPGERPLYPWKGLKENQAPTFDLNDALSKTGTIKPDSLLKLQEAEDEGQPAADDAKE